MAIYNAVTCKFLSEIKSNNWISVVDDDIASVADHAFSIACAHNNRRVAQKIYSQFPHVRPDCQLKNPDICQYILIDKWSIDKTNFKFNAFELACIGGKSKLVQWLCDAFPDIDYNHNNCRAFRLACANNHVNIAKILRQTWPTIGIGCNRLDFETVEITIRDSDVEYIKTKQNIIYESAFIPACRDGHLDIIIWLLSDCRDVIADNEFDIGFNFSCKNATTTHHIILIKYLSRFCRRQNITLNYANAFESACKSGNVGVASFLMIHFPDDCICTNIVFLSVCKRGHLAMAQWLTSKFKINIHANNERIFRYVCAYQNIDVAKWLTATWCNIDYRAGLDEAFKKAYNQGCNKMAFFISELYSNEKLPLIINWMYHNLQPQTDSILNYIINFHDIDSLTISPDRQEDFNNRISNLRAYGDKIKSATKL